MVEPGQSIPFDLYAAVAGILAYLYRQKVEERKRQERHAEDESRRAGRNESGNEMVGMRDLEVGCE